MAGGPPTGGQVRELGLSSLEKRRLCRDFVVVFQYLQGACRKAGQGLFIRKHSSRMRDNGFKLKGYI